MKILNIDVPENVAQGLAIAGVVFIILFLIRLLAKKDYLSFVDKIGKPASAKDTVKIN